MVLANIISNSTVERSRSILPGHIFLVMDWTIIIHCTCGIFCRSWRKVTITDSDVPTANTIERFIIFISSSSTFRWMVSDIYDVFANWQMLQWNHGKAFIEFRIAMKKKRKHITVHNITMQFSAATEGTFATPTSDWLWCSERKSVRIFNFSITFLSMVFFFLFSLLYSLSIFRTILRLV